MGTPTIRRTRHVSHLSGYGRKAAERLSLCSGLRNDLLSVVALLALASVGVSAATVSASFDDNPHKDSAAPIRLIPSLVCEPCVLVSPEELGMLADAGGGYSARNEIKEPQGESKGNNLDLERRSSGELKVCVLMESSSSVGKEKEAKLDLKNEAAESISGGNAIRIMKLGRNQNERFFCQYRCFEAVLVEDVSCLSKENKGAALRKEITTEASTEPTSGPPNATTATPSTSDPPDTVDNEATTIILSITLTCLLISAICILMFCHFKHLFCFSGRSIGSIGDHEDVKMKKISSDQHYAQFDKSEPRISHSSLSFRPPVIFPRNCESPGFFGGFKPGPDSSFSGAPLDSAANHKNPTPDIQRFAYSNCDVSDEEINFELQVPDPEPADTWTGSTGINIQNDDSDSWYTWKSTASMEASRELPAQEGCTLKEVAAVPTTLMLGSFTVPEKHSGVKIGVVPPLVRSNASPSPENLSPVLSDDDRQSEGGGNEACQNGRPMYEFVQSLTSKYPEVVYPDVSHDFDGDSDIDDTVPGECVVSNAKRCFSPEGKGVADKPGFLDLAEGEWVRIVQKDLGSGWTCVKNSNRQVGFVPSECLSSPLSVSKLENKLSGIKDGGGSEAVEQELKTDEASETNENNTTSEFHPNYSKCLNGTPMKDLIASLIHDHPSWDDAGISEDFDRDVESPKEVVCTVKTDIDPMGEAYLDKPGLLGLKANSTVRIVQKDLGCGWTCVRNEEEQIGFVPTECLDLPGP